MTDASAPQPGIDYPRTFQECFAAKPTGMLFYRLAQQAVAIGPAPYHAIISP